MWPPTRHGRNRSSIWPAAPLWGQLAEAGWGGPGYAILCLAGLLVHPAESSGRCEDRLVLHFNHENALLNFKREGPGLPQCPPVRPGAAALGFSEQAQRLQLGLGALPHHCQVAAWGPATGCPCHLWSGRVGLARLPLPLPHWSGLMLLELPLVTDVALWGMPRPQVTTHCSERPGPALGQRPGQARDMVGSVTTVFIPAGEALMAPLPSQSPGSSQARPLYERGAPSSRTASMKTWGTLLLDAGRLRAIALSITLPSRGSQASSFLVDMEIRGWRGQSGPRGSSPGPARASSPLCPSPP